MLAFFYISFLRNFIGGMDLDLIWVENLGCDQLGYGGRVSLC